MLYIYFGATVSGSATGSVIDFGCCPSDDSGSDILSPKCQN